MPHDKPFRLLLVRHGPAEDEDPTRWPDDRDRPLSTEGRAEMAEAAAGIARLVPQADRIASSGAARALATAELLRSALGGPGKVDVWEELSPGSDAEPILARVHRLAHAGRTFALVGHAPTVAELLGLSVVGDAVTVAHLARGGAALLEFGTDVRPGGASLAWLLTRRQLASVRR